MKRGGGRRSTGGRRVLVFAIAAAVPLAGGAAAAMAKAGGVSAVMHGFHMALASTNPYPRWQSGPGLIAVSPSASSSSTGGHGFSHPSPTDPCASVISATKANIPTGAKGLQNAIAQVEANCAAEPQSAGLSNALQHLLANLAKHEANGHGSAASGQGSDQGNGPAHGGGSSNGEGSHPGGSANGHPGGGPPNGGHANGSSDHGSSQSS